MKNKLKLLGAYVVVVVTILGNTGLPLLTTVPNNNVDLKNKTSVSLGSDEVDVDLENNSISSKNGINIKKGELELKLYTLDRDIKNKRIYSFDNVSTLVESSTGNLFLESKKGFNVADDGNDGSFYDNFGYLEVGKITQAQYPNDKIYFGSEEIEYKNGNSIIHNGWFTTDFNILKDKNPKNAGYHILAKKTTIQPDKQITFTDINLFLGEKDITPYSFPWFRMNIRKDSTVPLFPQWGTDDYYGWNATWGVLYGDKDSKFVGGIAPKFADRMGVLIGRWENWYRSEKYGTSQLNIDDWLVWSKEDKELHLNDNMSWEEKAGESISHEERKKRFKVNFNHNYNGEYGKLYLNNTVGTYNTINKLDDVIYDSTMHNKFSDSNGTNRPDLTKTIGFYSFNSDLKNLGTNQDISFKSNVKMTDDKKAYSLMVYDEIDDISYGSSIDNDLVAQFSLYKDNSQYVVGGYYNYLYDMDPGSTHKDTQSRAEDFGFEFFDKNTKIGFKYDEKNGDEFRQLNLWERDPNLDGSVSFTSLFGKNFNDSYTPTTVKKYDKVKSKTLDVSLGEYDFFYNYKIKLGYSNNFDLKVLNTDDDSLRSPYVSNYRDKQYNRFENQIYYRKNEDKAYINIFDDVTMVTFATGQSTEEFWDREGNYLDNSYTRYYNDSDFYEISAKRDNIDLNSFGNFAIYSNFRYDDYTEGDSSLRSQYKLNHKITLFDNNNDLDRYFDFSLDNELTLFYQNYNYTSDDNANRLGIDKEVRLKNKDNIYQVTNKLTGEIGNTQTSYSIDYTRKENSYDNRVNNEIIDNKLEFNIDDEKSIVLNYSQDKRFTDKNIYNENYNDLTFRNFGVEYYLGSHMFSYDNHRVYSDINNIENVQNSSEKINLNTYGYTFSFDKNKLSLDYSEGTDIRDITEINGYRELDIKNRIYGISYLSGGDVENFYRITYEKYQHNQEKANNFIYNNQRYNNKNSDILSLKYEYRDKRFSDKELKKYAQLEYNKDSDNISYEDLQRIQEILDNKNREKVDFALNSDMYSRFDDIGEYKRNFKIDLSFHRNEARYKITGDYWDSLEKIEGSVLYSQNRVGVSYQVKENSHWNSKKEWEKADREHKVSFITKIGKPTNSWDIKAYAKFYEDLSEINKEINKSSRKGSLDGLGIEIGKEFDYYQWSVAFEKSYVLSARDYEWRAGIQFKLLTFPTQNIFGIGAHTKTNKHTSTKTYLFDGIKVEDVVD